MEKPSGRTYRLPIMLSVFLHLALIIVLSLQIVGGWQCQA